MLMLEMSLKTLFLTIYPAVFLTYINEHFSYSYPHSYELVYTFPSKEQGNICSVGPTTNGIKPHTIQ